MFDLSSIFISLNILSFVAEISEFKGAWHYYYSRASSSQLNFLQEKSIVESVGAVMEMEGISISNDRIKDLLNVDIKNFTSGDEQDVMGYAKIYKEIVKNYENITFSEATIKNFHYDLFKYRDITDKHYGEYKNSLDNSLSSKNKMHSTIEAFSFNDISNKMCQLAWWTNEQIKSGYYHPLLVISAFIIMFLEIDPFEEGNKRLSWLLLTLLLLKSGYYYIPYASLEQLIEQDKEDYYLALNGSQASLGTQKPNINSWVIFFLKSLQRQKNYLEQEFLHEKMLKIDITDLGNQILLLLKEHEKLNISQIVSLTKANRNTIKKYLAKLTQEERIIKMGKGKATWYTLP